MRLRSEFFFSGSRYLCNFIRTENHQFFPMKKLIRDAGLLLVVLFITLPEPVSAQESSTGMTLKYFNKTEVGTALGIGSFKGDIDSIYPQHKIRNNQIIFPIQTINGVIISGRVGIGLGLGIEIWKEGLFYPVFGHLFYDFKPSENTFFGSLNLGTAIGTRNETSYYASGKGGLLFSLGAGYKMKVMKRLQFVYELYYRYQAIESTYTQYNSYPAKPIKVDDTFSYNFAGFRIGILFH